MPWNHPHSSKSSISGGDIRGLKISKPFPQHVEPTPVFLRSPVQNSHSTYGSLKVSRSRNIESVVPSSLLHRQELHERLSSEFSIEDGPFARKTTRLHRLMQKEGDVRYSPSLYAQDPAPTNMASPAIAPPTKKYSSRMFTVTAIIILCFVALGLSIAALLRVEAKSAAIAPMTPSKAQDSSSNLPTTLSATTRPLQNDWTSILTTTSHSASTSTSSQPYTRSSSTRKTSHPHPLTPTAPPKKQEAHTTTCAPTLAPATPCKSTPDHTHTAGVPATPSSFAHRRYHAPSAWASIKKWVRGTAPRVKDQSRLQSVVGGGLKIQSFANDGVVMTVDGEDDVKRI